MDLFSIAGVVVRRWYVALPIVVIGLVIGLSSYDSSEPTFSASEELVVLEGPEDNVDGVSNPFDRTNDARLPAQLLDTTIESPEFRESLGLAPELDARISTSTNNAFPIIKVSVTAATPEGAVSVVDAINARAAVVLNEFQAAAGAPEATRYVLSVGVPVGDVAESRADGLRFAGAALAIALVLAVSVATAWDVVARRRRVAKPDGAVAKPHGAGAPLEEVGSVDKQ